MSQKLVDITQDGEAAELILGKPPRLLRLSIYLIAGLILVGVLWAYLSFVDIVIAAPGVVRPRGDLIKLQPLASGRLLEIKVKEGDSVKEGDLLVKIDGLETQIELSKTESRHEANLRQLDSLNESLRNLVIQQNAESERDFLAVQSSEGELEKSRRTLDQSKASDREVEGRYKDAQRDYERTKTLVAQGVLSQSDLDKRTSEVTSAEAARSSSQAALRIAEQGVSLAEQSLGLRKKQSEISGKERERSYSELKARITALEDEGKTLDYDINRLKTAMQHLELRSSVSGVVTSLLYKNPGEIVSSGSTVAMVAPDGVPWVVEALVPNRDAGPLKSKIGGRVKLKFDAFPFRDYGTLDGKLIEVSPDATANEKVGMVYKVQIAMDSLQIKRGRREGKIQLGMSVTAEIVKEEERILLLLFQEVRDRVDWE